jgi:hypothetical protein
MEPTAAGRDTAEYDTAEYDTAERDTAERDTDHSASIEAEIAQLRRELDRLTAIRDELVNIYVFDDADVEARAFDQFYNAYDEVHVKTRRFLLD